MNGKGERKRAQSERHARRRVKGSFMKVRLTTVHRSFHSLTIHYASETGAVRRYTTGPNKGTERREVGKGPSYMLLVSLLTVAQAAQLG